jgi:hypothetical protein
MTEVIQYDCQVQGYGGRPRSEAILARTATGRDVPGLIAAAGVLSGGQVAGSRQRFLHPGPRPAQVPRSGEGPHPYSATAAGAGWGPSRVDAPHWHNGVISDDMANV